MFRPIATLTRRLPEPPSWLRRGPFRDGTFTSTIRGPRLTSMLGVALGVCFSVCFATGLLSHLIQHPPAWFGWPSRPVELYRFTQGVHIATGLATIPLLTAKLWSVFPKLFAWPPFRSLLHALERLSVLVLIAAALFQLVTGLLNITYWYSAMPFAFLSGHYWVAWLAIGSVALHVAVKLPIVRDGLSRHRRRERVTEGWTRRRFLGAVAATAGAVTVATVGQTLRPLTPLSVLAPRRPDIGPQGIPVNTSATAAGIRPQAIGDGYRLVLSGPGGRRALSLTELEAIPQSTVRLPIACVEGWSAQAEWTGVRVADLIALVGAPAHSRVEVVSLQTGHRSILDASHTADELSLIALRLHGEPLHLEHGYPARLIAPNRPGTQQTKWVAQLRVMA